MIPVRQLLYKLDMRLNKVAAGVHQSIPVEDKILALNEAQIKLIKKKLNGNNLYGVGLDGFKKRYEDLQSLIVPLEKLAVTKTTEQHTSYRGSIAALQEKYFVPLDMYVDCSRDQCKSRPVYITRLIKHGDLFTMMANTNYSPSFSYQDTLALVSENYITVYTNDIEGDFKANFLYVTYLRYPIKIDIAGYEDMDGNPSIDQDSELVDYLEDELLYLTALELGIETENTPLVQMDQLRARDAE